MKKELMNILTQFGGFYFFVFLVILYFFIDVARGKQLLLLGIYSIIIPSIIRIFYFKERPKKIKYNNFFMKIYAASFPSVHATRIVILAYFFSKIYTNIIFIALLWALVLIVCYSRVHLKYHYKEDVIVGALLGLLLSVLIL